MFSSEKIAHDIAVSLLPYVVKQDEIPLYISTNGGRSTEFNSTDIVDTYDMIYCDVLKTIKENNWED